MHTCNSVLTRYKLGFFLNDFHQSASFLIKVKLVKIAKIEMSMVERNGFLGKFKKFKMAGRLSEGCRVEEGTR